VNHAAWASLINSQEQFFVENPVVGELILGNVEDNNADLELGKVLLEFEPPVNRYKDVEFMLGKCQEGAIFEGIPAFVMHGGGFVIAEEHFDARIYALVNEDAHSRIWLLAKSRTVRTCCREMEGYSLRN
jgi:hypothetical protein